MCLVRHSTIIFYKPSFVKHHLKYLAILPRFASRSAVFLCILVLAHLFAFYAVQIFRRKSAFRGTDFCTQRTQRLRPARIRRRRHRNFSLFQIRPRSGHRISSLLTPHSYLLTILQIRPRSGHRNFSFLISHFSFHKGCGDFFAFPIAFSLFMWYNNMEYLYTQTGACSIHDKYLYG